ncbi:hypothetical protein [Chryseobacterium potabilaquae]|uniref:Uncharacterized protein n=1 Tax=Chryseobacterium potabilaquae TaxID=2675057 RepID=A0A6N4XBG5_9FLAO|nr:hypothetical protein [Chryseobacterium potabilaquae]CAA7195871.1 hypothetical protein CHRY9293_02028 [Chryseobacterium potabilaquae]
MADKEKRFLEIEKRLEAQAKLNPELVRLTKLTAEQGKKILKEYEAEFNKVLDGYKDYCRVNGFVIPKDTNEFFSWVALRYPDENLPFIIEVAKNPYNYKLFHDYKERLFNNPDWSSKKEFEYLQKEIAEPQQINKKPQSQNTEKEVKKISEIKYTAKEYALAYIFDLWAKGEQIPLNRVEGGLNKKELHEIGENIPTIKKDTFYRAVKLLTSYDLNKQKQLQSISKDWQNAVQKLSNNWAETKEYLVTKELYRE